MKQLITILAVSLSLLFLPSISFAYDYASPGPGGGGPNPVGTISPPPTIPNVKGDPSSFVAGIVRNGIFLLLVVALIIGVIWIILAGYRFILASGDEKAVASAWSQIYWGLIGLVVVFGAFAIIKLVEDFFGVEIITGPGGFKLPQRP